MLQTLLINRPVANIYLKPEINTELNTQALYSHPVQILESIGIWNRVKTVDGEEGWIQSSDLISNPQYQESLYSTKNLSAHIYRFNDTRPSPPMLTLPYGSKIKVSLLSDERWIPIELVCGTKAWIQRGDVDFAPSRKSPEEIIPFAMKFLGLPYTWGGTSSFGYDCSGFIQMLFSEMGYRLPRNARDQIHSKLLIAPSNLLPLDLLFFGEESITHVGLYLGDGNFLHAGVRDAAPMIGISNLNTTKYTYRSARRLIDIQHSRYTQRV